MGLIFLFAEKFSGSLGTRGPKRDLLAHCMSMLPFDTLWKHTKNSGFLIFSGHVESEHYMGYSLPDAGIRGKCSGEFICGCYAHVWWINELVAVLLEFFQLSLKDIK